jgi:hypothetical protein
VSEIPQTCSIEPFRYQATPQPSGDQGASAGQINEQTLEDYLDRLRRAICEDLVFTFDRDFSFLGLTDTPDSYAGAARKTVNVNAAEDGLEFLDPTFLGLIDTPNTYVGSGGFAVAVKGTEDGLEFVAFPTPVLEPTPLTSRLIVLLKPTSGTALVAASFSTVGHNQVTLGGSTLSHPVPSNANVLAGIYRLRINSAGGAGSIASVRESAGQVLGFAGWRMIARWGTATAVAQQRFFVGLINQIGAIANVNPSTLTDLVGFSYDSAQTNLFFIHNDAAGAATVVNLGAGFPVNTTSFYEMQIEMAPGSGVVTYRLLNVGTGAVATGNTNTNLPADATLLNLYIWLNNGTTAVACTLDTQCLYLELYK